VEKIHEVCPHGLEDISIQSWKKKFFNIGLQFQMALTAICGKILPYGF